MKKTKTRSPKAKTNTASRPKRTPSRAHAARESQQFLTVVSLATVLLVIFLFLIFGKNI